MSRSRSFRCSLLGIGVALACVGGPAAAQAGTISANPSPLQFSTQVVGDGGNWQQLTVTNDNTTSTQISSLSFGGADAGEFQLQNDNCTGTTLVANGFCSLNVQWNPQRPGVKSAHLDVASDGSPNPLSVSINATALAGPRVSLSPGAISFPDTLVGAAAQQTVTVTNTGDTDLFVGEMFAATGTPQVFPISSDGCTGRQQIAPNASCQFTVGFRPIAGGSKEATLFLITNTDRNPVMTLPIVGTGVVPAPPVAPVSPVAPAAPISNRFTIVGRTLDPTTGRATITARVPGPGRLDGVAAAPSAQLTGTIRRRPVVVARARATTLGAGRVKLVVDPSPRAKAVLAKRGHLHVSVVVTYSPHGGRPRSTTIGLTLALRRVRRHH